MRGLGCIGQGLKGRRLGKASAYPAVLVPACRELTLQKGDIVYIHKEVDKNWLEGEHHGRLGIFPANYVEVSRRDKSKWGWEGAGVGRDLVQTLGFLKQKTVRGWGVSQNCPWPPQGLAQCCA